MDLDLIRERIIPWTVTLGLIGALWAVYSFAQAPAITSNAGAPAADYHPTEVQQLRLESRQKDLIITQSQLLDLQHQIDSLNKQFKLQLDGLHDTAAEIARENKWPEDTKFSDQYLVFSKPKPGQVAGSATGEPK